MRNKFLILLFASILALSSLSVMASDNLCEPDEPEPTDPVHPNACQLNWANNGQCKAKASLDVSFG